MFPATGPEEERGTNTLLLLKPHRELIFLIEASGRLTVARPIELMPRHTECNCLLERATAQHRW